VTHWHSLPYSEAWAVDAEYYPGSGYGSGGRDGDPITPLCLVAIEMRTGRIVRLWQDELGPVPPYRLDADVLIVSFMATAEFGFHLAAGWGEPASSIDAYIEFRHLTNDARIKSGDRPKGFHSLAGALRYFGADEIDVSRKSDMRDRILMGPSFTNQERAEIMAYCEDDARALARLFRHLLPTIPSLPHALHRARFAWATAMQERRGVPIDLIGLSRLRTHWDDIRVDLVETVDRDYRCYEIVDGVPHFRDKLFAEYLRREGIRWPKLFDDAGRETDKFDERAETFRDMARTFPQVDGLRELRSMLSKLRLNKLAVGSDGRNRTMLGPFGTKTGRNAPGNSKFVFGPARCIRPLIMASPGRALIHRDYSQQEVRVAAAMSGDGELLAACESGDVYLGIAEMLGFPADRPGVRELFKTVTLGIQYGLAARSLASRAGISLYEAGEILARLQARFRVFNAWCSNVADYAGLNMTMSTSFGWTAKCPIGTNVRTIRNWPVQSAAAEILHIVAILAERRGVSIVAPVHDAFVAEAPVADAADVSLALDKVMRKASAMVLRGYELPTDHSLILPGQRYRDDRGAEMWNTINRLIDQRVNAK
jgi:DNA polymerase-1